MHMTVQQALAIYEAARHRLPDVTSAGACTPVTSLADIADRFDVFLLDAFGVLNIGETAIPGAPERIAWLQAAGKQVMVLTNAAGASVETLTDKYARLGYRFASLDIISSRAVLIEALASAPDKHWGVMAADSDDLHDLDEYNATILRDDPGPYDDVDGFLLLGCRNWTEDRQSMLKRTLRTSPREVWVGNPDVVAPREHGFSVEPGYFAHRLADRTGVEPRFFGKPFNQIYDFALARIGPQASLDRVVMVGDSLHTDVLGAHAASISAALVSDFGFFGGEGVADAIGQTGLRPDFILARP